MKTTKAKLNDSRRHSTPHRWNVENCSCMEDMQDLLFTFLDASTLSIGDLLNLSLEVSLYSLETTHEMASLIDILTIIQDSDFDAQHFSIRDKTTA